ncbi:MAG: hypothetical protein KDK07_25940 [Bauldia sp.]|nr:hypothetical protein [Bauldia sp.]
MNRLRGLLVTGAMVGLLLCSDGVHAHPPYFTEIRPITLANGDRGSIRVLAGDGIVISDPLQVIIVTSEGNAVAATPTSSALHISCRTEYVSSCRVSDPPNRRIYVPDEASFGPFAKLESDERGPYYPEYGVGRGRGFTEIPPRITELLLFEFTSLQPFVVFILTLPIWGIFDSLLARPRSNSRSDIRAWVGRLAAKLMAIALFIGIMDFIEFSTLSILLGMGAAAGVVLAFKVWSRRPTAA